MDQKPTVVKSKNRFLKLLPKAASAVTFQSQPFSPNKEIKNRSSSSEGGSTTSSSTKPKTHLGKGNSGAGLSIIPAEAMYNKSRNSSFLTREPTSPKVSCMGQVKYKKKMCSLNKYYNYQESLPAIDQFINKTNLLHSVQTSNSTDHNQVMKKADSPVLRSVQSFSEGKKKKGWVFRNMFSSKKSSDHHALAGDAGGVGLSQMTRFSSGRSSLSNFDWTAVQIAPVESSWSSSDDRRDSGHDKVRRSVVNRETEVVKISDFCAPKMIGECKTVELGPKKEVNLWKRRTMAQPKPLELNNSLT